MSATTSPKANWTVMVYFAADNDLEDAALANLQMMKKAGSSARVNILAQLDTRQSNQTFRYHLQDEVTTLEEDVVETMGEINTGDPAELVNFVKWAKNYRPATHHMLVIWGHGMGFNDVGEADRAAQLTTNPVIVSAGRSFSISPKGEVRLYGCNAQSTRQRKYAQATYTSAESHSYAALVKEIAAQSGFESDGLPSVALDDTLVGNAAQNSTDALKLDQLSAALEKALGKGEKIDLLGMDACLMGLAELGQQVKDNVRYLVASQDVVPRDSWPYDRILKRLTDDPGMGPEEFAVWIVREYLLFYRERNKDVTQAVYQLSACDRLAKAVKDLGGYLQPKLSDLQIRSEVMLARTQAQTFYLKNHVDLFDFCRYLERYSCDETLRKKATAVMDVIFKFQAEVIDGRPVLIPSDETFVFEYGVSGHRLRGSKGVSLYFPSINPSKKYKEVAFNRATGWFEFLTSFAAPFARRVEELTKLPKKPAAAQPSSPGGVRPDKAREGTVEKAREGTVEKAREGTVEKAREGTVEKVPVRPDLTLPLLRRLAALRARREKGAKRAKATKA